MIQTTLITHTYLTRERRRESELIVEVCWRGYGSRIELQDINCVIKEGSLDTRTPARQTSESVLTSPPSSTPPPSKLTIPTKPPIPSTHRISPRFPQPPARKFSLQCPVRLTLSLAVGSISGKAELVVHFSTSGRHLLKIRARIRERGGSQRFMGTRL
ncbi:hypothetical protein ABW19_dt0203537 [Dactylella cylindrospora]|nr:hypothetical protein ABW19_dt0203537 [Dactylella cylindrospora]